MKTLAAIHGVPFRKIVKREQMIFHVKETLSCGHEHVASCDPYYDMASKRRCRACKLQKEREEERGKNKR